MDSQMPRRDFLKTAPAAVGFFHLAGGAPRTGAPASRPSRLRPPEIPLETFDYRGVTLLDSRWKRQADMARAFYFGLTNDDILHGFRAEAGLPAPGDHPVRGWGIRSTAGAILGQWLSGMARMALATSDDALWSKAVALREGWADTLPSAGPTDMSHYQFDKMVCGLVDLFVYAGDDAARPVLARLVDGATRSFDRARVPASAAGFFGRPSEWYTLSENLYRAFQATQDERYLDFARIWLYEPYWSRFADTAAPEGVHGVHAYSHVNTFSSAAMHYEVTGDARYLQILRNAFDYLQDHQCYATGGFGPDERFLAPDGALGRALEMRPNTFETVCGSWAGFKLARYLQRFTGEARHGDWMERLLYNGVGAALPITTDGRNFYYSDYRCTGGMKVYRYDNYTCCSGTYFQCMADLPNLVYYRDGEGVYVNLFLPSRVTWTGSGDGLALRQETDYPVADTSTLTVEDAPSGDVAVRFRVPAWCEDMALSVNGSPTDVECRPGRWATLRRAWRPGDRIEVRIPQSFRWQAVDRQHPNRSAIVRGAVVMPLEFRYLEPEFRPPPDDAALNEELTPDDRDEVVKGLSSEGAWLVRGTHGRPLAAKVRPFFQYTENYPYLMYIDSEDWPARLW